MTCKHRWLVEPPNGSDVLRARCKKCKKTRVFEAVPSETRWNRAPASVKLKKEAQ